jgi:tetratricopeptide (TPR) repeat protein
MPDGKKEVEMVTFVYRVKRRLRKTANDIVNAFPESKFVLKAFAKRQVAAVTVDPLADAKIAVASGHYDVAIDACNALLTDAAPGLVKSSLLLRAEAEYAQGNHAAVEETAAFLIDEFDSGGAQLVLGRSQIARGQFDAAIVSLTRAMSLMPTNQEPAFLLANTFKRVGDHASAWRIIEKMLSATKVRPRAWHVAATLVQTRGDLASLMLQWERWRGLSRDNLLARDAHMNVAQGATALEDFDLAARIMWQFMFAAARKSGGFGPKRKKSVNYSSNRAEVALGDLNRECARAGIDMFLISGTLLGCVRENRLLGHDKDIDVGIWWGADPAALTQIINGSGLFHELHSRTPEIIRLRHVNGTAVDLFQHRRSPTDYSHQGIKMIWHNAPFKLIKHRFLDDDYLIPEDYDLYLTENYGDWRTPKIAFDSVYDTPNGEPLKVEELALHALRSLADACAQRNWASANFYLAKLEEHGHGKKCARLREILGDRLDVVQEEPTAGQPDHQDDTDEAPDAKSEN